MAESFFFYDLETSGVSSRASRIMQFAGRRTDTDLTPIGEPINRLITLPDDVLPDPEAVLLTGITPQQTIQDGETEAEFLRFFDANVALPDTTFVGFNNVRFDDDFMRYALYRNYYDPYEWQWKDGRSRWDLLDVVRMTRALRPEGIEWPFAPNGKPANRLEFLTKLNKLDHAKAHDALSDVDATIAVAGLLKGKQPKLFEYLLKNRDKKLVASLVETGEPFTYTTGRYSSEFQHTSAVIMLAPHPNKSGCALVYDLRYDPTDFTNLSPAELAKRLAFTRDENAPTRLPVKELRYNACPAVAPLGVLNEASQERIQLDIATIKKHLKLLAEAADFTENVREAFRLHDKDRQASFAMPDGAVKDVDGALYDGFYDDTDRNRLPVMRAADPSEIMSVANEFHDERLRQLALRYKAHNYAASLTGEERSQWEAHRAEKLFSGGQSSRLGSYFARLAELATKPDITDSQRYLLEELQLYGQSIMPADVN